MSSTTHCPAGGSMTFSATIGFHGERAGHGLAVPRVGPRGRGRRLRRSPAAPSRYSSSWSTRTRIPSRRGDQSPSRWNCRGRTSGRRRRPETPRPRHPLLPWPGLRGGGPVSWSAIDCREREKDRLRARNASRCRPSGSRTSRSQRCRPYWGHKHFRPVGSDRSPCEGHFPADPGWLVGVSVWATATR